MKWDFFRSLWINLVNFTYVRNINNLWSKDELCLIKEGLKFSVTPLTSKWRPHLLPLNVSSSYSKYNEAEVIFRTTEFCSFHLHDVELSIFQSLNPATIPWENWSNHITRRLERRTKVPRWQPQFNSQQMLVSISNCVIKAILDLPDVKCPS